MDEIYNARRELFNALKTNHGNHISNLSDKDHFGFGFAETAMTIITDETETDNAVGADLMMAT